MKILNDKISILEKRTA